MARGSISAVLPNYNHAHFVAEAIEAIARQTLRPIEIIIVDDASTDNSVEVIESLRKRYPIVRLLRNERNEGPTAAVNRGLEQARGDYVTCLASDDRLLPEFCEKSVDLLSRHPRAGLCSTMSLMIGEDGGERGLYHTPRVATVETFLSPRDVVLTYKKHGNWIIPNSVVYRRSAIAEAGYFDPELGAASDGFLHQLIALKHGACFIPEPLAAWRDLPSSYAKRYTATVQASLAMMDRMEDHMRTKYRKIFPEDYIAAWKRRSIRGMVYGLSRRGDVRYDELAILGRRLPDLTWLDRAYFGILRADLGCGRCATKWYVFLQHPWHDWWRIATGKLKRSC